VRVQTPAQGFVPLALRMRCNHQPPFGSPARLVDGAGAVDACTASGNDASMNPRGFLLCGHAGLLGAAVNVWARPMIHVAVGGLAMLQGA
jgi:hypothetical protein